MDKGISEACHFFISCGSVRMMKGLCCVQDKLVASVCHGPAAFTEAELDGKPFVKGKKVVLRCCT